MTLSQLQALVHVFDDTAKCIRWDEHYVVVVVNGSVEGIDYVSCGLLCPTELDAWRSATIACTTQFLEAQNYWIFPPV